MCDVRRLGIDFVASPCHADSVIVIGPVVSAVGACACSCGIIGRGYASVGGVAEALPVDVFIPGCPPRPEAIIFGILLVLGRLVAFAC